MKSELPMAEAGDRAARRATTLVRGEQTDGRLAVVDLAEVAGHEPPCHLHTKEDEILCVVEGALTVWVGEDVHRVAVGACLFLPRGIEHGYAVESAGARLLVVLAPAGLEGFFGEDVHRVAEADASRTGTGVERLIGVAARYGVAITGPPPTVGGSAPSS